MRNIVTAFKKKDMNSGNCSVPLSEKEGLGEILSTKAFMITHDFQAVLFNKWLKRLHRIFYTSFPKFFYRESIRDKCRFLLRACRNDGAV